MQLSNVFYNPDTTGAEHFFLNDRVEALRSLLTLVQREIESLNQLTSIEEKQLGDENFRLTEEVERFECELIRLALIKTRGHPRRAARLLGLKPTTLNIKIKKYEIDFRLISSGSELLA